MGMYIFLCDFKGASWQLGMELPCLRAEIRNGSCGYWALDWLGKWAWKRGIIKKAVKCFAWLPQFPTWLCDCWSVFQCACFKTTDTELLMTCFELRIVAAWYLLPVMDFNSALPWNLFLGDKLGSCCRARLHWSVGLSNYCGLCPAM